MASVMAAAATAVTLAAMSPQGAALLQRLAPGASDDATTALLAPAAPPAALPGTLLPDTPLDLSTLHPAARALATGGHQSLGVGLSGSGFLAFFFIGVLSALRDLHLIDQGSTKFAGASGGAIIAMASSLGCPYETGVRGLADLLADSCERTGKSCFGTLDVAVRAALYKALEFVPGPYEFPGDAGRNATVLDRVNGRTFVGVSLAPPSRHELSAQVQRQLRRESARTGGANGTASAPPPPSEQSAAALRAREQQAVEAAVRARASKPWLISTFPTVEDGIAAARASSFIPGFSGPRPLTTFRGRAVFDGMLTVPLPCPEGVRYCLRVSAVPKGEAVMGITVPIREADIAPGLSTNNGTGKYSKRDWDSFTLSLSRVPDRREVEGMGYREAVAWARQAGLADPAFNRALAMRGAAAARSGVAEAAKERSALGPAPPPEASAAEGRTGNGGVVSGAAVAGSGEAVAVGK
jgi:hypothetical protein